MSVLVTGASGFTGKALVKRLLKDGENVVALVRNPKTCKDIKELGAKLVVGNVKDRGSIEKAIKDVQTVYHIAALFREAGHPDSEYWKVNVEGTKNVLDSAVEAGVKRFVHCSTIGVCGHIENPPADETTPYNPHDIYQVTKMEGEKLALRYAKEGKLPVVVARPASIYGPGDLRLLKMFRLIKKRLFVVLGNGKRFFHMVYIDDLVEGFLLCAKKQNIIGEIFILGGEKYYPQNIIFRTIAEELGVKPPWIYLPAKPFQLLGALVEKMCVPFGIEPPLHRRRVDFYTMTRAFNIDKAKRILGYLPKFDLRTGIKNTAEWYKQQGLL